MHAKAPTAPSMEAMPFSRSLGSSAGGAPLTTALVYERGLPLHLSKRGLPLPRVRHGLPRLGGRQRPAFLQQLDGNVVGRAHECHVPVARRPVDRDAVILQALAGGIDVVHRLGEVTRVTAASVRLRLPVIGELFLRAFVARRREIYQRELALRDFLT